MERVVADEAGLTLDEASQAIDAFVETLGRFVPVEAWRLVVSVTGPRGCEEPPGPGGRGAGVGDFLLAYSEKEEVESDRAALHARVVAESVRGSLSREEANRLRELLGDDDFAALFEAEKRGELTDPDGSTRGVEQLVDDGGH